MKLSPIKYARTVTFGRFNIPHTGHVELIAKMLAHGEKARVYVSSGRLNNEWEMRVLALKTLCRSQGVEINRVTFDKADNPYRAVDEAVNQAPYSEVALVLGSDQSEMGAKLSETYDVAFLPNDRTNSSTNIRFFLDRSDSEDDLNQLYKNNKYAVKLAKLLRYQEIHRERPQKTPRKTTQPAQELSQS